MSIRDAGPPDIEQICALIEQHARYEGNDAVALDRAAMRGHLFGTAPKAWVLVAEVEGHVAGFALCSWSFSTWEGEPGIWMDDLFIQPEYRRYGLGRALMHELRRRTNGRVEWEMQAGNDRAEAFYRELGAEPVHGWVQYRWAP